MANLTVRGLLDDFVSLLDDTTSELDVVGMTIPAEQTTMLVGTGVPAWVKSDKVVNYRGNVVTISE